MTAVMTRMEKKHKLLNEFMIDGTREQLTVWIHWGQPSQEKRSHDF